MVNLLFISSNPKIDIIKIALQPLLKVKIDIVGDFDYGLKEVFEKRPTMVFIQDQIAGVTGESVARHIQMLLGSGSPSFIFMHDGNLKAKPIKGLYDYLIDLSQDDTKAVIGILSTLKSLLGPQWQKIYILPKKNKSLDIAALAVSEDHRVTADKLVDDFISGLGDDADSFNNKSLVPDVAIPESPTEVPFQVVSSTQDQLEEIYATSASELKDNETDTATVSDSSLKKVPVTPDSALSSVFLASSATSQQVPVTVAIDAAAIPGKLSSAQAVSPENESSITAPIRAGISGKFPSLPISPADFRIKRERMAAEVATEESLRAFEANYLSKTAARKWYQAVAVVLVLCLMGGGWYLVKHKPYLLQSVVKEATPAIVPAPAKQPVTPVPVVQKSLSANQMPELAVLPSFIPLAGHDRLFSSQKPGWERYVGNDSEYRLFRSGGKLRAVQVLATKGRVISESRLKAILNELTGTGEYRITSREQKLGYQVSRATVYRKADMLIYRKKSAVHAFVVSLD